MRLFLSLILLFISELALADAPIFLPRAEPGFISSPEASKYSNMCGRIYLKGLGEIKFKDMERRLICGDAQSDSVGVPWSQIPPNEAAYFLTAFFQTRGYHRPIYIQDGDNLFVDPGSLSRLLKFNITGAPSSWDPPKRRLVLGNELTPALIDDLQGWALTQIKNEGYPCAKAEIRADPETGEARAHLTPNDIRYITGMHDTGDTGLREGVLDRYNAFLIGGLYRDYLIQLTRKRTQEDGFLETYVMTPICDPKDVRINREVVLGPSRTIRIGVGGSTDEGAKIRTIIRQNRIGDSASAAQARIILSQLNERIQRQFADANFRWFYAPGEGRSYVEPSINYDHSSEAVFETSSFESKVLHGWNHEFTDGQFELRAGPTFLDSHQFRGQGPNDVTMTYAETDLRWTSHEFEFNINSPRTGETLEATLLMTLKKWGANFTAQKFQLQGEKLWSVFRYDPPLLILGIRFNASSVFSGDENPTSDLPVRFLTFLGGDQDLRGFERASLPRSGVGALSGATGGFEARFHKVIWRRADAITFLDSGMLGGAQFALRKPVLMSPGIGVRWESPVGVLRGYIAQRFAIDENPTEPEYGRNYRLGITYGQEF
jgi:translocation and assembly module TamA